MKHIAPTDYPIHELFKRRWSPVAFSPRQVEPQKLAGMLEAARWAPSSYNEQPWRFIVATREDEEGYQNLLSCLNERNQEWAQTAPVLMISVAHTRLQRNDKPNRHAFHDVGLATAHIMLQATAVGLSVHAMAGFDIERTRSIFQIPEAYEPVTALAVGYHGDVSQLSERLQKRKETQRSRMTQNHFVFSRRWGQSDYNVGD